MIEFLDGPAAGQKLDLRGAPSVLRVVCNAKGKWDALDQPEDAARTDEVIYLYVRKRLKGAIHVSYNPPLKSGWRFAADYTISSVQPKDEILRDNAAYEQWLTQKNLNHSEATDEKHA